MRFLSGRRISIRTLILPFTLSERQPGGAEGLRLKNFSRTTDNTIKCVSDMPETPNGNHLPVEVTESAAQAAFRILHQDSLTRAVPILLDELLREAVSARFAFLVIRLGGQELGAWGAVKNGKFLEDVSFLLNHKALRRAFSGDVPFVVEGLGGEGGTSFGPELFIPLDVDDTLSAVASVRRDRGGAPFTAEESRQLLAAFSVCLRAMERLLLRHPAPEAPPVLEREEEYWGLTCLSPAMRRLAGTIERIKDRDFNVCIVGESGTGKELVARAVHKSGSRRDGPFVAESAGSITESLVESELFGHVRGAFTGAEEDKDGLFVMASGGILYLDEIGDMSPVLQTKLLRVIQESMVRPVGADKAVPVDVRILSSTNRDLEEMLESGAFRSDLYWRLNVVTLEVPPLRERKEDLPYLIACFLKELKAEGVKVKPLSESALGTIEKYHWPGNIRQLKNVLRRAAMLSAGREITKKDIEKELPRRSGTPWRGKGLMRDSGGVVLKIPLKESFKDLIAECEKAILLNALTEHSWNKSAVTRDLRIPRQSLYNKMEKYGLLNPPQSGSEDI